MTREEREKAIDALKFSAPVMAVTQEEFNDYIQTLNKIMNWLEQEPCDDAISRQAVTEVLLKYAHSEVGKAFAEFLVSQINDLPPVTPQYTEAEIQKMQDLEFAEIQKAYEIGKAENPNKWIPVSERYPTDANKRYLVCYEDGCITIEYLYFDGAGYPFFSEMELGVIAWMPLPLPYKASPTGAESEG